VNINLDSRGLRAIYPKEWECNIVYNLLKHPESEMSNGEVHYWLIDAGYEISRASVNVAMKRMAEDGLLKEREEKGRGGGRFIYQANCDLLTFWQEVETKMALFMGDAYVEVNK